MDYFESKRKAEEQRENSTKKKERRKNEEFLSVHTDNFYRFKFI